MGRRMQLPWAPLLLGAACVLVSALAQEAAVGDTVCVEGFVMDTLCIRRGTLLDNPSVVSLEEPGEHSFHCLLDVDECIDSGYNILLEPTTSGGLYTVAYRVDDAGRDLLLTLGRSVGQMGSFPACSTCEAMADDSLLKGFRAEVTGVVTSLGSGTELDPPVLTVTTAVPSNGRSNVCLSTTAVAPISITSPTTAPTVTPASETSTTSPPESGTSPTAPPTMTPATPETMSPTTPGTNAPMAALTMEPVVVSSAPTELSTDATLAMTRAPVTAPTTETRAPATTNTSQTDMTVSSTRVPTTMPSLRQSMAPVAATAPSVAVPPQLNATAAVAVGDTVCVEGYVMDTLCIDRGTLLDNPTVRTLEKPFEHSLHCLVDVDSCIESGYNILREPTNVSGGLYTVAYRVDVTGRDLLVSLGRSVGQCDTCENGMLVKGFRAEVAGQITSLDPPTLNVTAAAPSNGRTDVCTGAATSPNNTPLVPTSSTRSVEHCVVAAIVGVFTVAWMLGR